MSETFNLEKVSNYNIKGYNVFYNESTFNKNDGLVIYVKENISVISEIIKLSEINLLRCTFQLGNKTFGISATYRPPSTDLNLFLNDFEDYILNLRTKNTEIFIGDLNLDISKNSDFMINIYLNILSQRGFFSCINKPTRISENSSSVIDHIFIKSDDLHNDTIGIKPIIFNTAITDHYTIALSLKLVAPRKNMPHSSVINKINFDQLYDLLQKESWEDVINCTNIEVAYNVFINKLKECIKTATKTIQLKSKLAKIKPWITIGIITSIRKRDNMKKELLKHFSNELNSKYKKYRNTLNKLIKKTKTAYYKTKIKEANNNYKQMWNIINEFSGNQKNNATKNIQITDNQGNIIQDEQQKANSFNDFFINIGTKLSSTISSSQQKFGSETKIKNSIYLTPVSENELITHISSLKNNSAPGEDGITVKVIKLTHKYLLKPLMYIINLAICTSQIPKEWKISIVTPVYKAGDSTNLTNYRPISVINNFGKIFEKCIKKRLVDFLEKENVLYQKQFGFRNNKNTEDAVFDLTNNIMSQLSNNKKCLVVFLDLAKAFDTVSHKILLEKLNDVGVRGNSLMLFQNYLTNRIQKVKINESLSSNQLITTGVPQGTVLGPILFLIYINELGKLLETGSVISYADDTAILFNAETWDDVYQIAERGLSTVQTWLNLNLLSLNTAKTQFITFSSTFVGQPYKDNIKIHQCSDITTNKTQCKCPTIQRVSTVKYLGIMVDQHLRWTSHADHLSSKIRKLYYKFYQLRDVLNRKFLRMLYSALVESILRYCIIVWGGLYNNSLKNLSVTQNTLLKIIFQMNRMYNTQLLYKQTEILNIRGLYIRSCLNYLPKINKLYQTITHRYQTKSNINDLLQIPFYKKSHNQRYFMYFAPKFYNLLPSRIRALPSHLYKKEIKKYISQNIDLFLNIIKH